jgi:hypothetical protein
MTMQFTCLGVPTQLTGLTPKGLSLEAGPNFIKPFPLANKGFFLKLVTIETKAPSPSL